MYLAQTFIPASLARSDSLYGLGIVGPNRFMQIARAQAAASQSAPAPVSAPAIISNAVPMGPRLMMQRAQAHALMTHHAIPQQPRRPVVTIWRGVHRGRSGVNRLNGGLGELGWFQAVANIIGAGAQVYASKEAGKAQATAAQAQREGAAIQKELMMLESDLIEKRRLAASQNTLTSPRNLAIGAGLAGAATIAYIATRKKRR